MMMQTEKPILNEHNKEEVAASSYSAEHLLNAN